mmetsp:Transcript_40464/g.98205  ORF Transcript_40464/g.98205 Transcript_40464/m.98205 type:complete len:234 (+) Transcript_40464:215-916(+)
MWRFSTACSLSLRMMREPTPLRCSSLRTTQKAISRKPRARCGLMTIAPSTRRACSVVRVSTSAWWSGAKMSFAALTRPMRGSDESITSSTSSSSSMSCSPIPSFDSTTSSSTPPRASAARRSSSSTSGSTMLPSATHAGQSHAPSGTSSTGGSMHCWWKLFTQRKPSHSKISLPADESPPPHVLQCGSCCPSGGGGGTAPCRSISSCSVTSSSSSRMVASGRLIRLPARSQKV